MKKTGLLTIIVVISVLILSFTGCGKDTSEDTGVSDAKENSTEESKIVNDDGEEFVVNIEKRGTLQQGAESINSEKLIFNGKEYKLPIRISELTAVGWTLPEGASDYTFEPKTYTNLASFNIYCEDGTAITLKKVYNDSEEEKGLEECLLTSIGIDEYYMKGGFEFTLPGGITKDSTAGDVLEVLGNPNNNKDFEGYSYNLDKQLTYSKHKQSGLSYSFTFNEDGTIYSVHISVEE